MLRGRAPRGLCEADAEVCCVSKFMSGSAAFIRALRDSSHLGLSGSYCPAPAEMNGAQSSMTSGPRDFVGVEERCHWGDQLLCLIHGIRARRGRPGRFNIWERVDAVEERDMRICCCSTRSWHWRGVHITSMGFLFGIMVTVRSVYHISHETSPGM